MELSDLRIFARVVDSGSLSSAARFTGLPKSSISRALTRLEGDVGAALLDRSGRRIRLTDAGNVLHPHAVRMLNAAAEAQASLDDLCEVPKGTLKVNVPFAFAAGLLSPMLADFLKRHPQLQVVLDVDNRRIDLASEEADLAIRIGALPDSELVARRLASMALWTCASPAYLKERGQPAHPRDLDGHRLVSRVNQLAHWRYTAPTGEPIDIAVAPRTVIPDVAALLPILANGCGIGRLPDFLAAPAVRRGELVRLLPDFRSEVVDVHAVYTSRKTLAAKSRAFIDAVARYLDAEQANWR